MVFSFLYGKFKVILKGTLRGDLNGKIVVEAILKHLGIFPNKNVVYNTS